jgi:hypothetical protein
MRIVGFANIDVNRVTVLPRFMNVKSECVDPDTFRLLRIGTSGQILGDRIARVALSDLPGGGYFYVTINSAAFSEQPNRASTVTSLLLRSKGLYYPAYVESCPQIRRLFRY